MEVVAVGRTETASARCTLVKCTYAPTLIKKWRVKKMKTKLMIKYAQIEREKWLNSFCVSGMKYDREITAENGFEAYSPIDLIGFAYAKTGLKNFGKFIDYLKKQANARII